MESITTNNKPQAQSQFIHPPSNVTKYGSHPLSRVQLRRSRAYNHLHGNDLYLIRNYRIALKFIEFNSKL